MHKYLISLLVILFFSAGTSFALTKNVSLEGQLGINGNEFMTGVVTATAFYGNGAFLTGITGISTAAGWTRSGGGLVYTPTLTDLVAVGTMTATSKLTVYGTAEINGNLLVDSVNGRIWGINGLATGQTVYFQFGGDANNRIENTFGGQAVFRSYWGTQMYDNQGEISRFGTTSTSLNSYFVGNVRIGATGDATATLEVRGGIYQSVGMVSIEGISFRVDTSEAYFPLLSGVATASAGSPVYVAANGKLQRATSSRRYKHDIRDLEYDQDKLLGLRPVRFKWNETNSEDFGLIAEEVLKQYPQLVVFNAAGLPDGVDYARVSVIALRAVQEQQKEIDALKEIIKEMQAKAEKTK